MKSRKLISMLCAASMVATSFAAVITAQASGEETLWSDGFNNYDAGVFLNGTSADGSTMLGQDSTSVSGLTFFTTNRGSGDRGFYTDTEGTEIKTGSYYSIEEKDEADKYLRLSFPMFGDFSANGRWAHVDFSEAYTVDPFKDIVMDFDVKLTDGMVQGDSTTDRTKTNPVLRIGTFDTGNRTSNVVEIDKDAAGIGDDWEHARIIVSAADGAKLYINGIEIESAANANLESIAQIGLYLNTTVTPPLDAKDTWLNADAPTKTPVADIDNVIIYSADAGTTTATSDAPGVEDQEQATPTPTAKPAAAFDKEVTVDFDATDIEGAGFTPSTGGGTVTSVVSDATLNSNVWEVVQTSSQSANNQYGYAKIDFSSVTDGKSHIGIDYDLMVGEGGRIRVVIGGDFNGSTADGLPSLFRQGIVNSTTTAACIPGSWVHTSVDVDLAAGIGSYKVTSVDDNSLVDEGPIIPSTTDITSISLVSWSANTSYLDNLVVKAGGSLEMELATPEPESKVEGSLRDLMPEGAAGISDFSNASSGISSVLNHSFAQTLNSTDNISAYSDNVRGKSIYAAYDVYLTPGSSTSIVATGNSGNSQSSTMKLTTNKDNTVTVSADTDKGVVKAEEALVADTWYRVLVEVPQSGTAEAQETGTLTFTIYRINADDPTQVQEIAAQLTGLSPRGVATRGVTAFNVTANGDVFVDNSTIFVYTKGYAYISAPVAEVTPEPASNVEGSLRDLAPEGASTLDLSAAEGEMGKVLNHSFAKKIKGNNEMNAYFEKARGKSVYVAYDVLVEKGATVSLIAHGDSGKAAGPTLQLIADNGGGVTVSAVTGSTSTVTAKQTLAAGTWYRVVAEFPQTGTAEATSTGKVTYTVYRIDAADPSKTAGVAAQLKDLSPRGLDNKSTSSMELTATGTAYMDNGVIYLAATAVETYTKYTATYADGRLVNVTSAAIENPTADDTTTTDTTKTFVWTDSTGEPFLG